MAPAWSMCRSRLLGRAGLLASRTAQFSTMASTSTVSATVAMESQPVLPPLLHSMLPSETFYVFDGTAMMYQAFHGSESKRDFKHAVFSKEFHKTLLSDLPHMFHEVDPIDIDMDTNLLSREASLSSSALAAMAMRFARFVRDVKPSHVAVAYDTGKSFRREMLQNYKSHRPKTQLELLIQLHVAPALMRSLGCRTLRAPAMEADDVMASVGCWARSRGLHVVHVSVDKDMLQLVDEGVHVMHPYTQQLVGGAEVHAKLGVPPHNVADFLALMGDAADNIPGAMGVGEKTAARLLARFGSLEGLIQQLRLPAAGVVCSHPPHAAATSSSTSPAASTGRGAGRKAVAQAVLARAAELHGEVVTAGLARLDEALRGSGTGAASAPVVFAGLLGAGADNLRLYRRLTELRRDLRVPDLLDAHGDEPAHTHSVHSDLFRFRGEARRQSVQVQQDVEHMSSALRVPLQLLRQQYHRLDRS